MYPQILAKGSSIFIEEEFLIFIEFYKNEGEEAFSQDSRVVSSDISTNKAKRGNKTPEKTGKIEDIPIEHKDNKE